MHRIATLVALAFIGFAMPASATPRDVSPYGHPKGTTVNGTWTRNQGPVATKADLKALAAAIRTDGDLRIVAADGSLWRFVAASTAADTTENLVLTPTAGTGRWLRVDVRVDLKLAVSKDTADAAVLFTVPAGYRLSVDRAFWEVTTGFTGGSSSAIGLSSSNTAYATAGDILGGASGDVTATLGTAGIKGGTIGAKFGSNGVVVLEAGDTIKFNRVTSAYTAGAGFVHALVQVAQ